MNTPIGPGCRPAAAFWPCRSPPTPLCRELMLQGKLPGREIAVFGFDNTTVSQVMTPAISTVAQPRRQLGETAMELLAARMAQPDLPEEHILLPHRLILRDSTGGPCPSPDGLSSLSP